MTATEESYGPTAGSTDWRCRRAINEERLRLAQEVHDIVGHGLVVIQMQADISRHVAPTRPELVHAALDAISRSAADALAELRTALAAIAPPDTDRAEAAAPDPGLHLLEHLCGRIEEAGVALELSVHGHRRPLPRAVDTAAYRVLQESLTNVVKHSPHSRALVEVTYRPDAISLTVANEDLAGGTHTEGFGIAGMRRRVERLGGELSAGTGWRPGHFHVHATMPTSRREAGCGPMGAAPGRGSAAPDRRTRPR